MEDIRLGREKVSRVTIYTADNNGQVVIPADPARTAIRFSCSPVSIPSTPANLNASTSAANTAQAPTIASTSNQRITVNQISIFASAPGNATLSVSDGTFTFNLGTLALTTAPTSITLNETFGNGTTVTFSVGAAGVGTTTTISASGNYSASPAGAIYLSDKPMNGVNQGIAIAPHNNPKPDTITLEEHGNFVRTEIFAFVGVANAVLPVLETALFRE